MAEFVNNSIVLKGRMRKDGVTFYTKNGRTIMRSAVSEQPKRRTRGQFATRQRMAHNTTLWKRLRAAGQPLLAGGGNSYGRFNTLMRKLPVVYLTKQEHVADCALLMPGMPVSDGPLPDVAYRLGEVGGRAALLTSLRLAGRGTTLADRLACRGGGLEECRVLRLYRLEQKEMDRGPWLAVTEEDWDLTKGESCQPFDGIELAEADGCLALVGEEFADECRGWALVPVAGNRSSSQTVVTRCRLYEEYTTEEALQRSAKSYGGLTGETDEE